MTLAVATPALQHPSELAWLAALADPPELERRGWDEASGRFVPDPADALFGYARCPVRGCEDVTEHTAKTLCTRCQHRYGRMLYALNELSRALERREDRGTNSTALRRADITSLLTRLGRLESSGKLTARQRRTTVGWIAQRVLLPRVLCNPDGRLALTAGALNRVLRRWVSALDDLVDSDGHAMVRERVIPYAFRHSYAQRHADNGTPIDVLAELMGHTNMNTTQGYYSVGEARQRSAVRPRARRAC